jgi:predicted fused transcriptional regulator/phosphomethylpyrimidine kinase
VNIAQAVEGAFSKEEVASFPGRLMERNGRITGALPAEFGASRHLANTLLWAMEGHPEVRSVINLGFCQGTERILESRGSLLVLDRNTGSMEGVLKDRTGESLRYLVDPGDFGVEPCLYIFGRSSRDVVLETLELGEILNDVSGEEDNEN